MATRLEFYSNREEEEKKKEKDVQFEHGYRLGFMDGNKVENPAGAEGCLGSSGCLWEALGVTREYQGGECPGRGIKSGNERDDPLLEGEGVLRGPGSASLWNLGPPLSTAGRGSPRAGESLTALEHLIFKNTSQAFIGEKAA